MVVILTEPRDELAVTGLPAEFDQVAIFEQDQTEQERNRAEGDGSYRSKAFEACLLEVVIGGQGISEAALFHNDEGDAVHHGPCLIGPGREQMETLAKEIQRGREQTISGSLRRCSTNGT